MARSAQGSSLTLNGGSISLGSTTQFSGILTLVNGLVSGSTGSLNSAAYAVQNGTITAALLGSGSLAKTTSGEVILAGTNTYSGTTSILAGTLTLLSNGAVPSNSPISINGGSLNVGVTTQNPGSLLLSAGNITGSGTLSGGNFTLESGIVSAMLAGPGTLTKNTLGEAILAAANTFSGTTTLNAGTLTLAVNNALASLSDLLVNSGELALGSTSQSANSLTLNNGVVSEDPSPPSVT
jgi:autotransporter-associated beta strand protein